MAGNNNLRYAEGECLRKYYKDINISMTSKKKLARKVASLLNDVINNSENPGYFAHIFSELSETYPYAIIKELTQATKNYIDSRDFNYPGKYKERSWLGGAIKYVSVDTNNATNKALSDTFDKLNAEYTEKAKAGPSKETSVRRTRNPIKSSHKFILGIILFTPIVQGEEVLVDNHGDKFGLAGLSTTAVKTKLSVFYTSYSNAPITEVKLFGFGETHNNYTHLEYLSEFLPKIGKRGDIILFEGVKIGVEFPCSKICIAMDQQGRIKKDFDFNCIKNMNLSKFKCIGSDSEETDSPALNSLKEAEQYQDAIKQLKETTALSQEIIALLNNQPSFTSIGTKLENLKTKLYQFETIYPKILPVIHSEKVNLDNAIKAYYANTPLDDKIVNHLSLAVNVLKICANLLPKISKMITDPKSFAKFSSELEINLDPSKIIVSRNKGIIQTLELPVVKNHQGSIFLLWGGNHFFKNVFNITKPKPGDHQHELWKAIEDQGYKYWIGFPK